MSHSCEESGVQKGQDRELVSVIIPTKNEGELLESCLKSVYAQSLKPMEVLIVDGGSSDNTLNIAESFGAKIITEQAFSSPANARNLGVENSTGSILLIMDADVILQEDCVENAVEVFRDQKVIAILPSELEKDDSYIETIQRKWNEGSRSEMSIGVSGAKTSGLVAFYRKEVLEKVKYDIKYGFGEDDDFSIRVKKEFADRKVVVAENCKVISHSPHTFKEFGTRYMWWGRTFIAYLSRHLGAKSIINMGSLLLPVGVFIAIALFIFIPQTLPLLALTLALFIAKISVICIRSKSVLFIQFVLFDFARSFFFIYGLITSLFARKKGR